MDLPAECDFNLCLESCAAQRLLLLYNGTRTEHGVRDRFGQ